MGAASALRMIVMTLSLGLAGCAGTSERGDPSDLDLQGKGLIGLVDAAHQDYKRGQYSAARQKLERVLEAMPRDAGMHARAANAAYREGQYGLASTHYSAALEFSDRPLPRVRYNLAMVRLTQAAIELTEFRETATDDAMRQRIDTLLAALEEHAGQPLPNGLATGISGPNHD